MLLYAEWQFIYKRNEPLQGKMWHPIPWLRFSLQTHLQITKPIITHHSQTPAVLPYVDPGQYSLSGRVWTSSRDKPQYLLGHAHVPHTLSSHLVQQVRAKWHINRVPGHQGRERSDYSSKCLLSKNAQEIHKNTDNADTNVHAHHAMECSHWLQSPCVMCCYHKAWREKAVEKRGMTLCIINIKTQVFHRRSSLASFCQQEAKKLRYWRFSNKYWVVPHKHY